MFDCARVVVTFFLLFYRRLRLFFFVSFILFFSSPRRMSPRHRRPNSLCKHYCAAAATAAAEIQSSSVVNVIHPKKNFFNINTDRMFSSFFSFYLLTYQFEHVSPAFTKVNAATTSPPYRIRFAAAARAMVLIFTKCFNDQNKKKKKRTWKHLFGLYN